MTAAQDRLLEQVKRSFQLLREQEVAADHAAKDVQSLMSLVKKHKGQKLLLPKPRRGAVQEYEHLLPKYIASRLEAKLRTLKHLQHLMHRSDERNVPAAVQVEMWRRAEALTAAPYTFEVLRHLPELQQIIAFTSARVICHAGNDADVLRPLCKYTTRQPLLSMRCRGPAAEVLQQAGAKQWQLEEGSLDLVEQLSPHMQLALAAEVAAGMLSHRGPTPPDTPEHGAVLKLFVCQAFAQVDQECRLARKSLNDSVRGIHSSIGQLWHHTNSAEWDLWQQGQHWQQQQQQQHDRAAEAASSSLLPPCHIIPLWDLTPHLDLQLQPHPMLLLQQLVVAAQLSQQQQKNPHHHQQQQQGAEHGDEQQHQQQPEQQHSAALLVQLLQQLYHSSRSCPATAVLDLMTPELRCCLLSGVQLAADATLSSSNPPESTCNGHHRCGNGDSSSSPSSSDGRTAAAAAASCAEPELNELPLVRHLFSMVQHSAGLGGSSMAQSDGHGSNLLSLLQHLASDQSDNVHSLEDAASGSTADTPVAAAAGMASKQVDSRSSLADAADGLQTADAQPAAAAGTPAAAATSTEDSDQSLSVSAEMPAGAPAPGLEAASQQQAVTAEGTSVTAAAAAAAAEDAAATAAAPGRDVPAKQLLIEGIAGLASSLVFKFIAEQVASGYNQALPLQALQLLGSVRQVEAAGTAALEAWLAPGTAAVETTQQQLVHRVLHLVQQTRDFQSQNTSAAAPAVQAAAVRLDGTTPSQGSCANDDSDILSSSSSSRQGCHRSSSSGQPHKTLSPSAFFAADGPLACSSGDPMHHWPCGNTAAALVQEAAPAATARCSSSSAGPSRHADIGAIQGLADSTVAAEAHAAAGSNDPGMLVVTAAGQCKAAVRLASYLVALLLTRDCEEFQMSFIKHAMNVHIIGGRSHHVSEMLALWQQLLQQQGVHLQQQYLHVGLRETRKFEDNCRELRDIMCDIVGLPLSVSAAHLDRTARSSHCQSQNDGSSSSRRRREHRERAAAQAEARARMKALNGDSPKLILLDDFSVSDSESDSESEMERERDRAHQHSSSGLGSSAASSSSTSSSQQIRSTPEHVQTVQGMLECCGIHIAPESTDEFRRLNQHVQHAAAAGRSMAHAAADRFAPLKSWHEQLAQRQRRAAQLADGWTSGIKWKVLQALAEGKAPTPVPAAAAELAGPSYTSGSDDPTAPSTPPRSTSSDALNKTQPAQFSSSSGSFWQSSPHDYHPYCPVCQAERQERRQAADASATTTSSSGSSSRNDPCGSMPVAYDDPFMWRRLLWQLLGKLSPHVQEFYATYLAMCPHCDDFDGSWRFVRFSVLECLWSPGSSELDVVDLSLSSYPITLRKRGRCLKQYTRALNQAYVQSYHPSTTLLSKQVLLALSPLHHQVLPPPELAAFLPSSFVPGIGKALMQQLFEQPVMDGYQHEGCRLHAWHVWWHVGLRRYHALKQRQQQQQQQGLHGGVSRSSRGKSSSGWDSDVSGQQLEQLYQDPDAKLYAVAFATKQLSGDIAKLRDPTSQSNTECCSHLAVAKALYSGVTNYLVRQSTGGPTLLHRSAEGDEAALKTLEQRQQVIGSLVVQDVLTAVDLDISTACHITCDPLVPKEQQKDDKLPALASEAQRAAQLYLSIVTGTDEQQLQLEQLHESWSEPPAEDRLVERQLAVEASDVAELSLMQPVAASTLPDPAVWWDWQQAAQGGPKCDVCDQKIQAAAEVVRCADCGVAAYCSTTCQQEDDVHDVMCTKLQQAQKRYSKAPAAAASFERADCGTAALHPPASTGLGPAAGAPGNAPVTFGFPCLSQLQRPQEMDLAGPYCLQRGGPDWLPNQRQLCSEDQLVTALGSCLLERMFSM